MNYKIFNQYKFCVFHRYVNAVDKALKSFEYTSEWADLISALGKLNKVKTIGIILYLSYVVVIYGSVLYLK